MINNIVAIFLIFLFVVLIAAAVWAFIRLHKVGMLAMFLRGKWLLSLLSVIFLVLFIVSGIALLMKADWAVPVLRYTIYFWLLYVWLYGLKALFDMIALLKWEKATSISQFIGRSKFFDELIEKSIELSKSAVAPSAEEAGGAHAVTDSPLEVLVNDEEMFKTLLPIALRKRIKRKVIGLLVQTVLFVTILILIG